MFRECLGKGGFGEVYRATMVSPGGLKSDVAVKLLHKASPDALRRLRDEGRLLASLSHPAILRVHDLASVGGRVALITEYVDGDDLSRLILGTGAPIGPRASVEVAAVVAEALHVAFTTVPTDAEEPLRLVHRDVKPSNIRLGHHGEVRLLDFGIAWARVEGREAETTADAQMGSLPYMAPERFTREPARTAADVYALGCTLFECLAGERLCPLATPVELARRAADPEEHRAFVTERLELFPVGQPVELRALLASMLAHDTADRPSASLVAAECEQLAEAMQGPRLKAWCRERDWGDSQRFDGSLSGRAITEESTSHLPPSGPIAAPRLDRLDPTSSPAATIGQTFDLSSEELLDEPSPAPDRSRWGGVVGVALVLAVAAGLLWALRVLPERVEAPEPPVTTESEAPPPAPDAEPAEVVESPEPDPASPPTEVAPRRDPVQAASPPPAPTPEVMVEPPQVAPPEVETPEVEVPAAPPPLGTIRLYGEAVVELRSASGTHGPGEVPAGSYELWADFGSGMYPQGRVEVVGHGQVSVRCNSLRYSCQVEY